MLGWSQRDLQSCLTALFAAACFVALGLTATAIFRGPLQSVNSLCFPLETQSAADVNLEAVIDYSESLQYGSLRRAPQKVQLRLEARPDPSPAGVRYTCRILAISIHDMDDRLKCEFERMAPYQHRYAFGSHLSDRERLALCKLWQIDPKQANVYNDQSLFIDPFTVFVTKKGAIRELSLSPRWRSAMEKGGMNTPLRPLITAILNSEPDLPALIGEGNTDWSTIGSFVEAMELKSTMSKQSDGWIVVDSETPPRLRNRQELIRANDLVVKWSLHPEKQVFRELSFDYLWHSAPIVYSGRTEAKLQLHGKLTVSTQALPTIPNAPFGTAL